MRKPRLERVLHRSVDVVSTAVVLGLVAALLWAVAIWALRYNHRHSLGIDDEPVLDAAYEGIPRVLAVIPARNEERNIGRCLDAVSRSDYPRLRIRVIDDDSTDRTPEIALAAARRDPRIEVLAAGALPQGWLGKNHALWVGTRGTDDDWLLFMDADLRIEPSCVARAVAAAQRRGADLLTMLPNGELVTFWEVAAQGVMGHFILVMLNMSLVNSSESSRAAAFGPFMLFRRSAYEAIGGHEAVRHQVVEDLRLAQAVKRAGLRLLVVRGTRLATLRMYDSLRAIVAGWCKNFHVAFEGKTWGVPPVVAGILFVYGVPWVLPFVALVRGDHLGLAASALALSVAAAARWDCSRLYGFRARGTHLAPLGALVVSCTLIASVLRSRRRKPAQWKARNVYG